MYQAFTQYSTPLGQYDERIDALIVQGHAIASTEKLIEKLQSSGGKSDKHFGPIAQYVLGNIGNLKEAFEPFWDTAFGRVQRCLEDDRVSAMDALGLVALRISGFGAAGNCEGMFSKPLRIRWGDRLLPEIDGFKIASDDSCLRLTGSLGGAASFVLEKDANETRINIHMNGHWKPLALASGILMLSADSVLEDVIIEDEFHSIFSYPEIDPVTLREYSKGLALLSSVPDYLQWVHRIVRGIVVCETVGSRTRSSSWSEAPGLVLISRSDRDFLIAEMLVHEASHQYYNLVCRCGNTVTESDNHVYYSPAVDRPRPLKKLLLGYHAFANMFVFYKTYLQVSGRPRAELTQTVDMLGEKLALFEQPLLESDQLTEIGRALFRPLYNRVCEVRI